MKKDKDNYNIQKSVETIPTLVLTQAEIAECGKIKKMNDADLIGYINNKLIYKALVKVGKDEI